MGVASWSSVVARLQPWIQKLPGCGRIFLEIISERVPEHYSNPRNNFVNTLFPMLNFLLFKMGFALDSVVKESAYSAGVTEEPGLIPGPGRSPGGGHGNSLQHSCLQNPMDRGACRAAVHRVCRVRHSWSDWAHVHYLEYPEFFLFEWTNTTSGTRARCKQQTSRLVIRNLLFDQVGFEGSEEQVIIRKWPIIPWHQLLK